MRPEPSEERIQLSRTMPSFKDLLADLIGRTCAVFLRLLALSWRSDCRQFTRVDEVTAKGIPVVAAFWHGSYLPLFALAAGRPITVFASRSFRGKIIASICRSFGYSPQLLPTGLRGYHTMREALSAKNQNPAKPLIIAIAVDGPLGPAHKVKPGALHIAAKLGAVLVPIRVASHPNWAISRRWDHFKIPLPLAKVKVFAGPPITIPAHLGRNHEQVKAAKQLVCNSLNTYGF